MSSGQQQVAGRGDRRSAEVGDYRAPAERDRDRILYSSAFRRLGGVTQVVTASETLLFHNRLTHSLKVAQIARRLAQWVRLKFPNAIEAAGEIDPDVVEAAALAHDLGHPPFGHIGEEVLNELLEASHLRDGFEGNAQSFRIVTKLAIRNVEDPTAPALNLSRATLRAVLKYPWLKDRAPSGQPQEKWGVYDCERSDFAFAVGKPSDVERDERGPEAHLMDWSDDVAYAVHDVQDFYRAGLIPLNLLRQEGSAQGFPESDPSRFLEAATDWLTIKGWDAVKIAKAFERIRGNVPLVPYSGSMRDRQGMHKFASLLITRYVGGISLTSNGRVEEVENLRYELEVLKQLTWYYVINRPSLASLQTGHRRVMTVLFNELSDSANDAAGSTAIERRLPVSLRELLVLVRNDPDMVAAYESNDDKLRARAVADYLSSLTEVQALTLFERITGARGSALEPWLRI